MHVTRCAPSYWCVVGVVGFFHVWRLPFWDSNLALLTHPKTNLFVHRPTPGHRTNGRPVKYQRTYSHLTHTFAVCTHNALLLHPTCLASHKGPETHTNLVTLKDQTYGGRATQMPCPSGFSELRAWTGRAGDGKTLRTSTLCAEKKVVAIVCMHISLPPPPTTTKNKTRNIMVVTIALHDLYTRSHLYT